MNFKKILQYIFILVIFFTFTPNILAEGNSMIEKMKEDYFPENLP